MLTPRLDQAAIHIDARQCSQIYQLSACTVLVPLFLELHRDWVKLNKCLDLTIAGISSIGCKLFPCHSSRFVETALMVVTQ